MSWTGYSNHYSVCQNIVDFLKPAVAVEASEVSAAPASNSVTVVVVAAAVAMLALA